MDMNTREMLREIMKTIDAIQYVKPEDVPNIDLYMDQVTTFMDEKLRNATRNPEGDKILTKTMINNYAKNNLLPSPEKKKYSKEHMLLLIFIYYLKGVMSIGDIQSLLHPITEKYFGQDEGMMLEDIYREVFTLERSQVNQLKKDLVNKQHIAEKTFEDAPEEDRDFLQIYSYICMLSFDVYMKKLMIEKMIDSLNTSMEDKGQDSKK